MTMRDYIKSKRQIKKFYRDAKKNPDVRLKNIPSFDKDLSPKQQKKLRNKELKLQKKQQLKQLKK